MNPKARPIARLPAVKSWPIARWEEAEERWVEITRVVASDPQTALEKFGKKFEADEFRAEAGEYGVGVEGTWRRFVVPPSGPIRWVE